MLISAVAVIRVLQEDIKMTCQTTRGTRLCEFKEKEREISNVSLTLVQSKS